jgi:hypothetical protein
MCPKVFTDEAPFETIPELVLDAAVGQQHKRLERPTDDEASQRGLSDGMWDLLFASSSPEPSRRPTFVSILETTSKLFAQWVPVAEEETFGTYSFLLHFSCSYFWPRFAFIPNH